jgi:hypothetical protein
MFYEAEISTDIILSNGWMAANKLVPLPEWNQLGLRSGNDIFALSTIQELPIEEECQIDTTPFNLKGFSQAVEIQDDEFLEAFHSYQVFEKFKDQFFCPNQVGKFDTPLNVEEVQCIVNSLVNQPGMNPFSVSGLVQTEGKIEHPLADELVRKLYEDYKDTVFRDEIYPNPQPRGPSGTATITLKKNAIPKYTRAIPCHGEKLQAMKGLMEK